MKETKSKNDTLTLLGELLEAYFDASNDIADIQKQQRLLRAPKAPLYVENESDLLLYVEKQRQHNREIAALKLKLQDAEQKEMRAKSDLMRGVPVKNCWFYVATTRTALQYWVGVQTSDWGGGEYYLKIQPARSEADRPEPLKSIFTSSN